jgi:hypothetical protein
MVLVLMVVVFAAEAWADTVSITGSTTIYVGQTKTYTVSFSGSSNISSYDVDVHTNDITKGTLCCPVVINPSPPEGTAEPLQPEGSGYEVYGALLEPCPPSIGNSWFTVKVTGVAIGQVTIYLENNVIYDCDLNELYPTMGSIVVNVLADPNNCLYVGRVFNNGLTVSESMMSRWYYLGMPACWCCEAQKYGNGAYTGTSSAKVDTADLTDLKAAYMKSYNASGYKKCSDYNLSGKIDTTDLTILKANYMHTEGTCY